MPDNIMTEQKDKPAYPLIDGSLVLIPEAWEIFKKLWVKLFKVVFVAPLVISLIASGLAISVAVIYGLARLLLPLSGPSLLAVNVAFAVLGAAVFIIPIFVAFITAYFAVIFVLENNELPPREAFRKGLAYFFRYLWLLIICFFIILAAYVFFIVPGYYLSVAFIFSVFILALENTGGWAALKRSRELIKGFWWTILARLLMAWLAAALFMSIVNIAVRLVSMLIVLPLAFSTGFTQGLAGSSADDSGIIFLIVLFFAIFIVCVLAFAVTLAANFVVQIMTIIYQYLLFNRIKAIKAADAKATDQMPVGKKAGLALLLVIPPLVAVLIIIIVLVIVSMPPSIYF